MSRYVQAARLENLPPIDELDYVLLKPEGMLDDPEASAYVAGVDAEGAQRVLAYIDGKTGATFRCDRIVSEGEESPGSAGEEPVVKLVGQIEGPTGQVVIKQPEGHWRRYSRWDRLPVAPATQPDAVVRTLPQCGCGGYLGAPMMFDSFQEMLAYFFVVFSDAQRVNAKHAAILTGDGCDLGGSCAL